MEAFRILSINHCLTVKLFFGQFKFLNKEIYAACLNVIKLSLGGGKKFMKLKEKY